MSTPLSKKTLKGEGWNAGLVCLFIKFIDDPSYLKVTLGGVVPTNCGTAVNESNRIGCFTNLSQSIEGIPHFIFIYQVI